MSNWCHIGDNIGAEIDLASKLVSNWCLNLFVIKIGVKLVPILVRKLIWHQNWCQIGAEINLASKLVSNWCQIGNNIGG